MVNSGFKLALQLYSLRAEMAEDLLHAVKTAADMGFEGVEFAGFYDKSAYEWREILDRFGLEVAGAHTPLKSLYGDQLDKTVEEHKVLSNRNLIVPSVPHELVKSVSDWVGFASTLNTLAGQLERHGMRVGYHCHASDFKAVDGRAPWDIVFTNTSSVVVMQVDTGNAMHAGLTAGEVINLIKRYPGRAYSVHLKDHSRQRGFKVVLGEGDMDWDELLLALKRYGGTRWLIVEQEEYPYTPPAESVRRSLENLRDRLSTVG
ncbi:MAG: sugar phosphate isomerase/epimerase family protein [Thermoprotei archaeon]